MTPSPRTEPLPGACDVLVVGAGPAGSACAQMLARGGVDVVLVDQHVFPRDKVCGDGLIPDAYAALRRLQVLDEVMEVAQPVQHVGCVGPSGGRIDVPGTMAVLPRRQLDDILCRAAQRAGARLVAPAAVASPGEAGGRGRRAPSAPTAGGAPRRARGQGGPRRRASSRRSRKAAPSSARA